MPQPSVRYDNIFNVLAEAVERLGERQVARLLRQAITQKDTEGSPARNTTKKGGARVVIRHELVNATLERLQNATSREEGSQYIEIAGFSRRELEALARSVDVPVRKDMRAPDLEDLIVNMTVGGRLNSRAIRGGS